LGEAWLAEEYEITVKELKKLFDSGVHINLIDVREPSEYSVCHISGSSLIPLRDIPNHVKEFNRDEEYVFYCHVGERSASAVNFLQQLGFKKVKNLVGGIDAWATEIDPAMPRY
jgi:rhodanese-related sulfurtransferase